MNMEYFLKKLGCVRWLGEISIKGLSERFAEHKILCMTYRTFVHIKVFVRKKSRFFINSCSN